MAKILAANLKEEKAADLKLNGIAKKKINRKAAMKAKPKKISRKEEDRMMQAVAGIPSI